jgi:transglutaminase-like putative cysteine protease
MRRLRIEHLTTYQFGAPVELGPHQLLIRPREGHDVRIEASLLNIRPANAVKWHRDFYGNSVGTVRFSETSDILSIASDVTIQHFEENPFDFLLVPAATHYPFEYADDERMELLPYQTLCYPEDRTALAEWISRFWIVGQRWETFTLLDWINKGIASGFAYAKRDSPGVQSPRETLRSGSGSCRDFASLFIEACRVLGFATRFVSGYLCTPGIPGPGGATHAWAEVYLPGAGWRGFDSTSGEVTGTSHIAAAVSRHPGGVPPISGSFAGSLSSPPTLWVGVRVSIL